MKLPTLPEIRKAAVAVAGVAGQVLALNFLHGQAEHYAQVVLAAATAVGVYGVRNGISFDVSNGMGPGTTQPLPVIDTPPTPTTGA